MRHVDEETLAMIALGEDAGGAGVAAHLNQCSECAHELAQLRHLVSIGQDVTAEDVPSPAPAVVWDRIASELGLTTGAQPGSDVSVPPMANDAPASPSGATPVAPEADEPLPVVAPAAALSTPGADDRGATVHELAPRRQRRSAGWLAVAASAGVIAGSLGGAWWASNQESAPVAEVLAQAELEPLPGWQATGVAQVEQTDGARVVVVQVDGELGSDGYREVWLLAPDLSGMVSLGLLTGSSGEFTLPEGLDLARYSVVDVSEEPFDGDAAHSGNSIVRGPLDA